jgi:hypothetical protein
MTLKKKKKKKIILVTKFKNNFIKILKMKLYELSRAELSLGRLINEPKILFMLVSFNK